RRNARSASGRVLKMTECAPMIMKQFSIQHTCSYHRPLAGPIFRLLEGSYRPTGYRSTSQSRKITSFYLRPGKIPVILLPLSIRARTGRVGGRVLTVAVLQRCRHRGPGRSPTERMRYADTRGSGTDSRRAGWKPKWSEH